MQREKEKKVRMRRFQQPFPIQPSLCSYLEFYPDHFSVHSTYRHHGVHRLFDTEWDANAISIAHTHLIRFFFFHPPSAKVILLFLFEYILHCYWVVINRTSVGLARWLVFVRVVSCCFSLFFSSFFITFWKTYHAALFFVHNTEHTNKHKCSQRKSKDAKSVAALNSLLLNTLVTVTCKHRVKKVAWESE